MITSPHTFSPDDVAGHYDDLDPYYRELWGEHLHHGLWRTGGETPERAVVQLIDHLAEALALSPGDRVCDVGCGYGATARHLAAQYQVQVTGVTLSRAQHAYAVAQGGSENVQIRVENWETNSFPDASFDALISLECLAHIRDRRCYFDQIARVLRPGGKAAITDWLAHAQASPWQCRHLLRPICREGRLAGLATHDDTREAIAAAGLVLLRAEDISRRVRRTWRVCARRLWWNLSTRPSYWRFLLQRKSSHSVFLLSVYRILVAYYLGAMRYGLFVMEKP